MTLLGRLLERRGADPTLPWGNYALPTNAQFGAPVAGISLNDDTALSLSTVLSCVSILANDVSTLPLVTLKKTDDRQRKVVNPQPALIQNPWPEGILQDWLMQVMVSLTLRGNFYGQITDRDQRGYATTIMPLHPDSVVARRDPVSGKRQYRVANRIVPNADIVHIPNILMPGTFIGLNPIEYMRRPWALAVAAESYGAAFFSNSANPSGIIQVPGDLSEEETLELLRTWKMSKQGPQNAQNPGVLTGGATWQQITITPDDAQFLATRDFGRIDIASFFQVPLHRLNIQDRTTSWGTGIEQMEIGYVVGTLANYLNRIEGYLSALLPPSQVVKFDLTKRLRGDTLQRFQSYQLARNAGLLTVNEIREKEDLPAVPNGDDLLQPMNMAPLGYDPTTDPGKKPGPVNGSGLGNGGGPQGSSPPGGTPGTV